MAIIEVIDRNSFRHRFAGTEWLRADYDSQSDVLTVTDATDDGTDDVTLATFASPIRWGEVSKNSAFSLPEKLIERCPRCGYGKV